MEKGKGLQRGCGEGRGKQNVGFNRSGYRTIGQLTLPQKQSKNDSHETAHIGSMDKGKGLQRGGGEGGGKVGCTSAVLKKRLGRSEPQTGETLTHEKDYDMNSSDDDDEMEIRGSKNIDTAGRGRVENGNLRGRPKTRRISELFVAEVEDKEHEILGSGRDGDCEKEAGEDETGFSLDNENLVGDQYLDGTEQEKPATTQQGDGADSKRVIECLNQLGFSEYAHLFEFHEVGYETLPLLTLKELEEIGINKVGVRRKMHDAFRNL